MIIGAKIGARLDAETKKMEVLFEGDRIEVMTLLSRLLADVIKECGFGFVYAAVKVAKVIVAKEKRQ